MTTRDPRLYVAWALLVIAALIATYFVDPYIFGFTALGVFWLSLAVAIVGFIARSPSRAARATILAASLASLAAALIALAMLRTFKWG